MYVSQKDTKLAFVKDGKLLSHLELANNLNKFYSSVNADIPPLHMTTLPTYLPAVHQVPYINPICTGPFCCQIPRGCADRAHPSEIL